MKTVLMAGVAAMLLAWGCGVRSVEPVAGPIVSSEDWPEAPCEIVAAEVRGNTLALTVQYGGGCAEHDLSVESAGPLLKSLPPKQPLRVVHRTPGDACRALIQKELEIDLKPWRGSPRGITVILLENWNEPLTYEYN